MAFDAMVQLADDAAAGRLVDAPCRAPATVVVRVDKAAFDRGRSEPGDVCEIPGVGPIPASVARRFSEGGPTALSNLHRLCHWHHDKKHTGGRCTAAHACAPNAGLSDP